MKATRCAKAVCFAFVFACVPAVGSGRQKPEDPKFEPVVDDAIIRVGIRGLGFPLYICGKPKDPQFEPNVMNVGVIL